ncbi:MAG TPA: Xaa-Pro aminopeptidase [Candidatus Dormibacteraeota bacterium]|nr:Xaa-Pro aminopeptidase [Candidatus Dormibacteraeota bacterium]
MEELFGPDFFAGNRTKLRQLFTGTAPIVITANGLLQRAADSNFLFEQDANFWYLTGCQSPDVTLVIDKDKEYLIVPTREPSQEIFDGRIDIDLLQRQSGITSVLSEVEGWKLLTSRLKKAKHVATIAAAPSYIEPYAMYSNPARANLITKIRNKNDKLELLDLTTHLTRLRMVKQTPEITAIKTAIDITIASFRDAIKPTKLTKYTHEYQIEAELTKGFRRRGARGHAFEPIVAGGPRACVLHNISNSHQLTANELVIIDVGAQFGHYAADITRTVSLETASRRQAAVYGAVLECQAFALSLLKPGVVLKDYEQQVEHFMGEKLRELGLLKNIEHADVRRYYPHATSHFLGLNVHDVGDYARPLEAGMIITVEPGIYIADEALGVRLEDDVLITETGVEILSGRLPKELG